MLGLLAGVSHSHSLVLSGVVVDGKAKPLAGAKVRLVSDTARFAITDAQGRFSLEYASSIARGFPSLAWETGFNRAGVFLQASATLNVTVSLSDTRGKVVHEIASLRLEHGTNPIPLPGNLPPGSYSLRIAGAGGVAVRQVRFDGNGVMETDAPPGGWGAIGALGKTGAGEVELKADRKYYRGATVKAADGATGIRITLEKLPNIVMILSDDQAWKDYGFMGHASIRTPNLDKLASQSLVFSRGYLPTSLCRPSIMTLSTGLFAHQHGVTGNDPPAGQPRESMLGFIDKAVTLQGMLRKEKGYVSLQTGKWWEGSYQRGQWTSGMSEGSRHGDSGLTIGRVNLDPIPTFLDTAGERPFYLWYAPMMPHQPHTPPQRLLDKYKPLTPSLTQAKYWAMVEWFDESCGELLKLLEQKGLRENTVVFYTADNGWIQDPAADKFLPGSKNAPNEGGVRTPMMVNWPGKLRPKRNDDALVSAIDFMPTMLEAVGIPKPAALPGVSLLDSGKVAGARAKVFGEIFLHDVGDVNDPTVGLRFRWTIQDRWKLIWDKPATHDSAGLYDILSDPDETRNVKAANPAVVAGLRASLDAWFPLP